MGFFKLRAAVMLASMVDGSKNGEAWWTNGADNGVERAENDADTAGAVVKNGRYWGRNATGQFAKGLPNPGRRKGAINKRTMAPAAGIKTDPLNYLSALLDDPKTEKPLRVQCASTLLPYLHPRLKEQAPRRMAEPLIFTPPKSASEAASAIAIIATRAASGEMDINDGADVIKMLESYVRAFAAADLEAIVARVREEVRAELLTIGVDRNEYQVPSAPADE
jgi:hypothetical protein